MDMDLDQPYYLNMNLKSATAPALTESGSDAQAEFPSQTELPSEAQIAPQPVPPPAPKKKRMPPGKGILIAAITLAVLGSIANQFIGWEYEPKQPEKITAYSKTELDHEVWISSLRLARDEFFGDAQSLYNNYVDLGHYNLRLGDTNQAISYLLKALAFEEGASPGHGTIGNGSSKAMFSLMEIYNARGDITKSGAFAQKWFKAQSWETNPTKIGQYLLCAHVCEKAGLSETAHDASECAKRSSLIDGSYTTGEKPSPEQHSDCETLHWLYVASGNAMVLGKNDIAARYLRFILSECALHEPGDSNHIMKAKAAMMLPVAEMGSADYNAAARDFPPALKAYQDFFQHLSTDQPLELRQAGLARERRALYLSYAEFCRRQGHEGAAKNWEKASEAGFVEELHPERWQPWWRK